MGIKQLYNDNVRKLPNEYGDVSVMKNKDRKWLSKNFVNGYLFVLTLQQKST